CKEDRMKKQLKYFPVLIGLLVLASGRIQAAEITVDAGGGCTLAEAIDSANNDDADGNGCVDGSGDDTIILDTDVELAFGPTARPPITSPVTIKGQGHTIDGKGADAYVLKVNNKGVGGDGDLILNNATITGGNHVHENGGGPGNGGGLCIAYDGIAELNNVTISGNTAANYGGGIFSCLNCKLTLNNCTISDNTADYGGGIHMTLNPPSLENILRSSIISGNTASVVGNEIYADILMGSVASEFNVFGHSGETDAQAFSGFTPGGSDLTTTSDGTDPTALADIIDPLADIGCALTHALPEGSPAIDLDEVCSTGLTEDQCGESRPVGDYCDRSAIGQCNNYRYRPCCDAGAIEFSNGCTSNIIVDAGGV
ncbi:MAG: hypothetical protein D3904_17540, partial [Candidatus Electrothrix sp. EH2]|nr:hypothetical protein [Candidatus Electrothrix sp. EH2]